MGVYWPDIGDDGPTTIAPLIAGQPGRVSQGADKGSHVVGRHLGSDAAAAQLVLPDLPIAD
jgi:hypothetical protein